jgi:enoyl-CoA hydratase/carnithine racemase
MKGGIQMEEKKLDYVIYQKEGNIARVILNRPEKLNVINMMGTTEGVWTDMHRGLNEAAEDDDVKVVILKGAGKCLTAGEDLSQAGFVYGFGVTKDARRPSQRIRLKLLRKFHEDWEKIMCYPKVLIGQGHGYCIGAGSMLLVECDLALVAEDAVLGYVQERVGGPGLGLTIPLILSVGLKTAKELVYTGKTISGKEAAEIKLVNAAVPAEELEERVEALAKDIARMPRDGLYIVGICQQ